MPLMPECVHITRLLMHELQVWSLQNSCTGVGEGRQGSISFSYQARQSRCDHRQETRENTQHFGIPHNQILQERQGNGV